METIPALIDEEPQAATPGELLLTGFGTVHVEGGSRVEGYLLLSPYWVTCLLRRPDHDGATRTCIPVRRVLRVDLGEDE